MILIVLLHVCTIHFPIDQSQINFLWITLLIAFGGQLSLGQEEIRYSNYIYNNNRCCVSGLNGLYIVWEEPSASADNFSLKFKFHIFQIRLE